jgi:FHS family L-fucose permease-like MFS transporter
LNTAPADIRQTSYRSWKLTWLVMLLFFLISLLTNIMGPVIPEVIRSFHVSLAAAGLLPFAAFLSYGLVSIPTGVLMERTATKRIVLAGLVLELAGALLFPAHPQYQTALASLFLMGIGSAALQVVINPLLRVSGGEEHYAFNSALAQFIFGVGSFLVPLLYSYVVLHVGQDLWLRPLRALTPENLPWVSAFWALALATGLVLAFTALIRMPRTIRTEEEKEGSHGTYRQLLSMPVVWLYFVTIFLYVGLEQGLSNWISQFLLTYHHFDPRTIGALAVSWFWGGMTIGCLVGMGLLKLFDSRRVLIATTLAAMATFTTAVFGPAHISVIAFPACGLFLSVMWPICMALGLNSLSHSHGLFAGVLCTAILGGAVLPPVIGQLGDWFGLRTGMMVLYISMGWVLSVGFWARPLVNNARVGSAG